MNREYMINRLKNNKGKYSSFYMKGKKIEGLTPREVDEPNIPISDLLLLFDSKRNTLIRDVLCLCIASKKSVIVANECLKKGLRINALKLEYLLILIHGKMLSQYNKPFLNQNVVVKNHNLMIEKDDKEFVAYDVRFDEILREHITLLEKEEEVMKQIIEEYGEFDVFELKEHPVLKTLNESFYNTGKTNIIPNIEIKKVFDCFYDEKQKFNDISVPFKKVRK